MAYNVPLNGTTCGRTLDYSTNTKTIEAIGLASGDNYNTQQQMRPMPKPQQHTKIILAPDQSNWMYHLLLKSSKQ